MKIKLKVDVPVRGADSLKAGQEFEAERINARSSTVEVSANGGKSVRVFGYEYEHIKTRSEMLSV